MAVVGTAYVRVELLSKSLGNKITKAVESSLKSSDLKPAGEQAGKNLGDSIGDGVKKSGLDDAVKDAVDRATKKAKKGVTVTINADADTAKAEHDLDEVADTRTATINADADTGKASVKFAILTRPRRSKIIPYLDGKAFNAVGQALGRLSGGRFVADFLKPFKDFLLNLDKFAPMMGAVGTAIPAISAGVFSLVSNFSSLAFSIAQIGPALLALPGLFLGAAAGGAVLIMAMKDMKTELKDVAPLWKGLQDTVSKNFWAKAAKPIKEMSKKLVPALKDGLGEVATTMGEWIGEFSKVASSKQVLGDLKSIFGNVNKAVEEGKKGIKPWITAFTQLGRVGATYLPKLVKYFNTLGKRFNKWIDDATKSGEIFDWIDTAIEQFGHLWDAVKGIGNILKGIGTAAAKAGGTSLKSLADNLTAIANVINSPAGQAVLIHTFERAHEAMQVLGRSVGPALDNVKGLATTIIDLMPKAAGAVGTALEIITGLLSSPQVSQGLTDLVDGFSEGLEGLKPAVQPVSDLLGSVLSLAGRLSAAIGPVLGKALEVIAPPIEDIVDALGPVVDKLGPALVDILDHAQPMLEKVGPAFEDIADAAVIAIPKIQELITTIEDLLGPAVILVLENTGKVVSNVVTQVGNQAEGWTTVLQGMKDTATAALGGDWSGVITGITTSLSGGQDALIATLQAMFPGSEQLLAKIDFTAIGTGITTGLSTAFTAIQTWWDGTFIPWWNNLPTLMWEGFLGLIENLASLPGRIIGFFANLIATLPGMVVGLITGLTTNVSGGVDNIARFFQELPGKVIAAVLNLPAALVGFFTTIWPQIVATVAAGIGNVIRFFQELPGKVVAALAPIVAGIGGALLRGMTAGNKEALTGIANVVRNFTSLPGKVVAALGSFVGTMVGIGKSIIDGLIRGIQAAPGAVASAIGGVIDGAINAAKNLLGIKSPSKVFANIGKDINNGLALGLTTSASTATTAMNKVISLVSRTASEAVQKLNQQSTKGMSKREKESLRRQKNAITNASKAANNLIRAQEKVSKALWGDQSDEQKQATLNAVLKNLTATGTWVSTASKAMKAATLADISEARGVMQARIDEQLKIMEQLVEQFNQMRDQIANTITGTFNLKGAKSVAQVRTTLSNMVGKAQKFAGQLSDLIAMGYPPALVQQIAALGLVDGSEVAAVMLQADLNDVAAIKADFGALTSWATQAGSVVADQMYGAGIEAQQGLIDGLEADMSKLEAAGERIAEALVAAVKKKLGIKSPSKVFATIGDNTVAGLVGSLEAGKSAVAGALNMLVDMTKNASGATQVQMATAGAGGGGTVSGSASGGNLYIGGNLMASDPRIEQAVRVILEVLGGKRQFERAGQNLAALP